MAVMGAVMTKDERAYPVPDRPRWSVCVQFLDGTQLFGNSDDEIIERWMRVGFWAADEMGMPEFKTNVVGKAREVYCAALIGIGAHTPSDQYLNALAAEGIVQVIRK
jgi:hypothetical protein